MGSADIARLIAIILGQVKMDVYEYVSAYKDLMEGRPRGEIEPVPN
jgi:hypothetical protein